MSTVPLAKVQPLLLNYLDFKNYKYKFYTTKNCSPEHREQFFAVYFIFGELNEKL